MTTEIELWVIRGEALSVCGMPLYWSDLFACFVRRQSASLYMKKHVLSPETWKLCNSTNAYWERA